MKMVHVLLSTDDLAMGDRERMSYLVGREQLPLVVAQQVVQAIDQAEERVQHQNITEMKVAGEIFAFLPIVNPTDKKDVGSMYSLRQVTAEELASQLLLVSDSAVSDHATSAYMQAMERVVAPTPQIERSLSNGAEDIGSLGDVGSLTEDQLAALKKEFR